MIIPTGTSTLTCIMYQAQDAFYSGEFLISNLDSRENSTKVLGGKVSEDEPPTWFCIVIVTCIMSGLHTKSGRPRIFSNLHIMDSIYNIITFPLVSGLPYSWFKIPDVSPTVHTHIHVHVHT